jgi:signal transduction histidine kinase
VLDLARADMTSAHLAGNSDVRLPLLRVADAYSNSEIRVKTEFAGELPPITLPAQALETCLSNLIENSRRAGAAQIAVSARAQDGAVLIEVQDDGPGIAEGDRFRIFEPFFTTRRESGGTGLGLSIVKSLLEAHGGTIVLREGADGAHFTLTLPASGVE